MWSIADPPPDLIATILSDHSSILTLFNRKGVALHSCEAAAGESPRAVSSRPSARRPPNPTHIPHTHLPPTLHTHTGTRPDFFQAASRGEAGNLDLVLGGLCVDIRLHSQGEAPPPAPGRRVQAPGLENPPPPPHPIPPPPPPPPASTPMARQHPPPLPAEMQVLYPLLSQRGGEPGRGWAQRSLSEHSMVEQSVAECLALRGWGRGTCGTGSGACGSGGVGWGGVGWARGGVGFKFS